MSRDRLAMLRLTVLNRSLFIENEGEVLVLENFKNYNSNKSKNFM